jgi:hypothetical protein
MKRLLSYFLLGVLALTSMGVLAFTPQKAKPVVSKQWFAYTGTDNTHYNDPSFYELMEGEPSCEGSGLRCAVEVIPDAGDPSQPDPGALASVTIADIRFQP